MDAATENTEDVEEEEEVEEAILGVGEYGCIVTWVVSIWREEERVLMLLR